MAHNDKYVNFKSPKELAEFLCVLTKEGMAYQVVNETNQTWSVIITGY